MYRVILLRHGQSQWNKLNRFTGWADVDLSAEGINETHKAGFSLRQAGYGFDIAFTSFLRRAIQTLHIVLEEMDQLWIPEYKAWQLNERHYGALEGNEKNEIAQQYGSEQVRLWRRSYDLAPPVLAIDDPRFPGNNSRYSHIPSSKLPIGETLKDTEARVVEYWHECIVPAIKQNQRVLIVAHGNSLRALIRYLNNTSPEDISSLEIPTGIPLIYELEANIRPLRSYYLYNPE